MSGRWAAALVAAALASPQAHAETVADFYRTKDITLIVGAGPGTAYDTLARLLARHLGRHIPGHPAIVVQNMPGAANLRAINYLYNGAPRDGATIANFARNVPLVGMVGGNPSIQFDPRKLTWLG